MTLPASHHRSSARRGFTLLELAVGLVMVAVVGVSLATAMSIAFRARSSAREQTNVVREAMIAMDVVQQEIASALPPKAESLLAGPFMGYSAGTFESSADTLEFYSLARDAGAPDDDPLSDGPRWIELSLSSDGERGVLVRRMRRNLLATVLDDPVEEALLAGVRAFGLRYFDGTQWYEEWDSTSYNNSLPLAVEVTLELDRPSPTDPEQYYRLVHVIRIPAGRLDLINQALTGEEQ